MDETLINQIAKSIPHLTKQFLGVFPKNQYPKVNNVKLPVCFIINKDKYLEPGSHWVSVFVPKHDEIYYFDSFGIPPQTDPYVMKILKWFNKKTVEYSTVQIQPHDSSTCGLYSIYFLYLLSLQKYSLEQCLMFFNHNCNLYLNDIKIKNLFCEIMLRNKVSIN